MQSVASVSIPFQHLFIFSYRHIYVYLFILLCDLNDRVIKVACLLEIVLFGPPKNARGVIFSRNLSFCFKKQGVSLKYQKVSSKNDLLFQLNVSKENSYFLVNIFYFHEHQLAMKISEEISYSFKCSQSSFFIKGCSNFYSFKLLLVKF